MKNVKIQKSVKILLHKNISQEKKLEFLNRNHGVSIHGVIII